MGVVVVIVIVIMDTGLVNLFILLSICLFRCILSNCLPILKLKGAKRFLLLQDNTFSVSNNGAGVLDKTLFSVYVCTESESTDVETYAAHIPDM